MDKTISVFGSSRPLEGDADYQAARELGRELARSGFILCNGGYGGIMEASARGAKERNGTTVGITVETFPRTANKWIDTEVRTKSLAERIAKLVDSAHGYVILRGGTGTLLELAYVWEFINKRLIPEKPVVLLGPFWNDLVEILRRESVSEGVGDPTRFIMQVETPQECARVLRSKLL
jgi:uncharacterized protein (TIGR00725 family)